MYEFEFFTFSQDLLIVARFFAKIGNGIVCAVGKQKFSIFVVFLARSHLPGIAPPFVIACPFLFAVCAALASTLKSKPSPRKSPYLALILLRTKKILPSGEFKNLKGKNGGRCFL